MSKVKFSFGSVSAFNKLESKSPDTIYVVNETGDFSSSSLDDDGDIYLGDKLLTGGSVTPAATSAGDTIQPNVLYLLGTLSAAKSVTLSSDFDSGIANEWHLVFSTGSTPYSLSIAAPASDSTNTYTIKGEMPILQSNKTYEVSVLYAGSSEGALSSSDNEKSVNGHIFLLSCISY